MYGYDNQESIHPTNAFADLVGSIVANEGINHCEIIK